MACLNDLKPVIRLAVMNPNEKSHSEFGPGVANLCAGVGKLGSLNAAAKDMGMAYSKAWRIIKDTESSLGITLLNRDGAHGSALTPEGERLLSAYYELDKSVQSEADKLFASLLA